MSISAVNFAKTIQERYAFGLDTKAAAETLRLLADDLEAGEVLLQSVRVTTLAAGDDFTTTGVRLALAEKSPKALYGPDSPLPVAIAKP